jgi:hypothetical protein
MVARRCCSSGLVVIVVVVAVDQRGSPQMMLSLSTLFKAEKIRNRLNFGQNGSEQPCSTLRILGVDLYFTSQGGKVLQKLEKAERLRDRATVPEVSKNELNPVFFF